MNIRMIPVVKIGNCAAFAPNFTTFINYAELQLYLLIKGKDKDGAPL